MGVLNLFAESVEEKIEVTIKLPDDLVVDTGNTNSNRYVKDGNYVYIGTRKFKTLKQPNQIREALMKGYVEMSQINLDICCECLHAEYNADDAVKRLVR